MRRALAFLTPFGRAATPDPESVLWFPLVGALVGIAVGGVWWVAAKGWGPLPAAVIVVGADLALTGMLHVDGLADAADGLLAHLDRERRLEVMAEPGVGAFGVAVVAAVLLARVGAFSSTGVSPVTVAGLWCLSRTVMAVAIRALPYARAHGLASAFVGDDGPLAPALVGVVLGGTLCFVGHSWRGEVAAGALVLAMMGVLVLSMRRIGGFTGDVLGAAAMAGETVGLLVLASKW